MHDERIVGEDTVLLSAGNGILATPGCPCGYFGSKRECKCSPIQIQRYVGKISGPLMDRIDIHIDVPAVQFKELRGKDIPEGESSAVIRERVLEARRIQL